MGKKQLLTWYEKNALVDKVNSHGKIWVGIFPKLYSNFLDEIVKDGNGRRPSVNQNTNFLQV